MLFLIVPGAVIVVGKTAFYFLHSFVTFAIIFAIIFAFLPYCIFLLT